MTSRREFVAQGTGLLAASTFPGLTANGAAAPRAFIDLLRGPDAVSIRTSAGDRALTGGANGEWSASGLSLSATRIGDALQLELAAPTTGVSRVALRWRGSLDRVRLLLGDAWERGYGDLEWRSFVPDRIMPWYVVTWDGTTTSGYGVRTGAASLCSWQVDPEGVTLWADVRSGGTPVQLGDRRLVLAEVITHVGAPGQSPFTALRAFCRQMCPAPRIPAQPVYGHNDWYWAYGDNSAASFITDANRIVELSPAGANPPYVVIDDGWQPGRGASKNGAGTWEHGNEKFPDMPGIVARVRQSGARTGAWIRPLEAASDVPDSWRLLRDRSVLDPTVAAVREKVRADMARLRNWGFDLIKHDYSSYDLFGRWGNQMGSALTRDNWSFAEGPGRTTAEVINELYHTIRDGAGDALVIGCNTMSHLSAGVFDLCRIGDDTSGREWPRTRKMGVNSLAFRAAHHGTFYAADPDCVGVTSAIPWQLNRQWLDLAAHSGTALFVSIAPDAGGAEQRADLKRALSTAAAPQPLAEPLDWQQTTWPSHWLFGRTRRQFAWGLGDE